MIKHIGSRVLHVHSRPLYTVISPLMFLAALAAMITYRKATGKVAEIRLKDDVRLPQGMTERTTALIRSDDHRDSLSIKQARSYAPTQTSLSYIRKENANDPS
ncbi:hypothetical protein WNY58_07495 [Neptuniibacter pectenicola]|uniref:Uncharacterized protein n=1 Tax=Neptuniibacter pectenicola TaxID=1806669 RepID=A0ABU9TR95_9GAMM